VKTTATQFDFKGDWIEFKPTHYNEYTVSTEFLFSSMTENTPMQLNFTIVSQYNMSGVSVTIQVWNYSSPSYVTSGEGYLTYTSAGANETKLLSINTNPQFYTSAGNAKINITGVLTTTTQYQQKINQIKLDYKYVSHENIEDYVDNNTSDVDSSADKGTHGNFTAQQYGSDSVYDTLTEAQGADTKCESYEVDDDDQSNLDNYHYAQVFKHDSAFYITKVELLMGGGGSQSVYLRETTGIPAVPKAGDGNNLRTAVSNVLESVSWITFTFDAAYLIPANAYYAIVADRGSNGIYWRRDASSPQYPNGHYCYDLDDTAWDYRTERDHLFKIYGFKAYELDLEVQWTDVDYNEANEELCIYAGTMGAEDLRVDVWNGFNWNNLFTDLSPNCWNNISVSPYLNSSTFTIRFKGSNETDDTTQDNWNIDATLLHVWTTKTYDYVLKVVNQATGAWNISLKVYDSSNINRILNLTISFYDGASSDQIIVGNGNITQSEGPLYNLPGGVGSTVKISMSNLQASTSGTSYLYVYLKILVPDTTTYSLYIITFEIT
jgi:hypothetical protein